VPFDWSSKLLDLVVGALPAAAKVLPEHRRRQALARLQDFNPLAEIPDREDLLRALRLAWVEAALEVDAQVLKQVELPEWQGLARAAHQFSAVMKPALQTLRHDALNRQTAPGQTSLDQHLRVVLMEVPTYAAGAGDATPGLSLSAAFASNLATVVGWPEPELPSLYGQIAHDGVLRRGGGDPRSFGDLVFAAFAEIVKHPTRYPEAGVAFQMAMQGMVRALALATLEAVRGLESRLDELLDHLRHVEHESLVAFDLHFQSLAGQVTDLLDAGARTEQKLDRLPAQVEAAVRAVLVEQLERLGAASHPPAVSESAVIALAQRLSPVEAHDFDRALTELRFAVDIAQDVLAKGEHPAANNALVDGALRQVAAHTSRGELDRAADVVDAALAELARRQLLQQEEMQGRRLVLLNSKFDQAMLRRDEVTAVAAVLQMGAVDDPLRPACAPVVLGKLKATYEEGLSKGVNLALDVAIGLARARLAAALSSDEVGESKIWLGICLTDRGERETGTARLEEAVQVYRSALHQNTLEQLPQRRAATYLNLGVALAILGQRERGNARLQEAVLAYREALKEFTQGGAPLSWAMTQNNLGNALVALGEREGRIDRLEEAVQAYRRALNEFTADSVPLDWAMTQNNLGAALARLGERQGNVGRLEEAARAFREALQEYTQDRMPLKWAMTQNNLGNVLRALGAREEDVARLEEAVFAHREALKEFTRERAPIDWALTSNNLGTSLMALGERERGTTVLEQAKSAFGDALMVLAEDTMPRHQQMALSNLQRVRGLILDRWSKPGGLDAI
jgi:tetratricopeptide (TPR) repeat protein